MKQGKHFYDEAIFILQNTEDGNQLSQADLRLVELAVNGFLSDLGVEKFLELHRKIEEEQKADPQRTRLWPVSNPDGKRVADQDPPQTYTNNNGGR